MIGLSSFGGILDSTFNSLIKALDLPPRTSLRFYSLDIAGGEEVDDDDKDLQCINTSSDTRYTK